MQHFLPHALMVISLVLLTESACPNGCACHKNRHVTCRSGNLRTFPSSFPSDTISIDMTKNVFKVLGNFSFKSTGFLKTLKLDNNEIEKIEVNAFKGAENIQYLYLRNNLLRTTEAHNFVNSLSILRNLKHLYLTHNQFKQVPPLILPAMTKLNLDDNEIEDGDFPKSFSQCRSLQSVILSSNRINFLKSSSFRSLRTVYILNLVYEKNQIRDIDPKAFSPIADTLRRLDLDRNQLGGKQVRNLISSLGSEGTNLNYLSVQYNSINVLNDESFKGIAHGKIFYVHLDRNPIHQITEKAFLPLYESVRNLTLTSCQLTTQLNNVNFKQMDSLQHLNLSLNRIKEIPRRLPRNVLSLDFRQNNIQIIPTRAFSECANLKFLNLRENKIDSIQKHAFMSASRLEYLDLSENNLRKLNDGTFFGLLGLKVLDLSDQSPGLAIDNDDLKGIDTLVRLNLRHNNLSQPFSRNLIKPFEGLVRLEYLDLEGCHIESLGDDVFRGLKSLKSLNLSRNTIKSWKYAFKNLGHSLKSLDLSNNLIRFVSMDSGAPINGLYPAVENLEVLDVSVNPYNCSCFLDPFVVWLNKNRQIVWNAHYITCASPQSLLNDRVITKKVGGSRCSEKPNVIPIAPAAKPTTKPKDLPISKPSHQSVNKSSTKSSVSSSSSQSHDSKPDTHRKDDSNGGHFQALHKKEKQKRNNPLILKICIGIFIALTLMITLATLRHRKSIKRRWESWKRRPVNNIHDRYSSLRNSEEEDLGFENPALLLRDDAQSLIDDTSSGVFSRENDPVANISFPVLNLPVNRNPVCLNQSDDRVQRNNSNISPLASEDLNMPRPTNGLNPNLPTAQEFVEPRPSHHFLNDGFNSNSQFCNPIGYRSLYESPANIQDVNEVFNHSTNPFLTRPSEIQNQNEVPPPIDNVMINTETSQANEGDQGASAIVNEVPKYSTNQFLTEGQSEINHQENETPQPSSDAIIDTETSGADQGAENGIRDQTPDVSSSEDGDDDHVDEEDALDLICFCAQKDSDFVKSELTIPLRNTRYSPCIHLLRPRGKSPECIQALLSKSRFLLIVNSEELIDDSEANRVLSICKEKLNDEQHGLRLIILSITIFGDEKEHSLLASLTDGRSFQAIPWNRIKPGVNTKLLKILEKALCEES